MTGYRIKLMMTQLAIAMCLLAVWEASARSSTAISFLIGSPSTVTGELLSMLANEEFAWHFAVTGSEAVIGLTVGTFLGLMLGLSLWFSDRAAEISRPFVIVLGAIPIIAFAPLMIIWFGIGFEMKVALAALSTLFIAFNQAHRGVRAVSEAQVDVMRGMNAPRSQTFFKVVVPGSMDWMFSSMRLNVGFGLLGAFIGEFIASDRGLGYLILRASALYNVPRAMAAAGGIAVLALLLDALGRWIERNRYGVVQVISVPRLIWRRA
jgi:NitT/TauT family transport system permease protein